MRRLMIGVGAALALALGANYGFSGEGDAPGGNPGAPAGDPGAWMAEHMKVHAPGAQHKVLAKFAGEWTCKVSMWMMPGGEPDVSSATSSHKMTCGGRFLKCDFKGSMGPMPFAGEALMGHDNHTKRWQMTWHDSMSSNISTYAGPSKETGGKIIAQGVQAGPMGEMDQRWTYDFKDDNTVVGTMDMSPKGAGQWFKSMEIVYTRKAATTPAAK